MNNGNRSAMPTYINDKIGVYNTINDLTGLTKREFFAGMAMQANRSRSTTYESWEDLAKDSVEMADSLLAELDKLANVI